MIHITIPEKGSYRLTGRTNRDQIEQWTVSFSQECVYAIGTPWWSLYEDHWMPYRKRRLPCDPRGSLLMQGKLAEFWQAAKDNPDHYGSHGLEALVLAFHANVEILTADGRGYRPTSLDSWDEYNLLLSMANGTAQD